MIVKYGQHTTKQALEKRWELVNYISKINKSNTCSLKLKQFCLYSMSNSMDKYLLLKILFSIFKYSIKNKKSKQEINQSINNAFCAKEDKQIYDEIVKKMFIVNIYNAIHWYMLFGALFSIGIFIYAIFRQFNKFLDNIFLMPKMQYMAKYMQYETQNNY